MGTTVPEDRRAVRRRRDRDGRGRRIGRIDDIREVHRNGVGATDLAVVGTRTSHPFSVCEPTWTPERAYVPSSERSICTGSLSTWKWTWSTPVRSPVVVYATLTVPPVSSTPSAGAVMTSFGAFGPGVTGFAMSVWISAWLSAARYTRTSSIRPLKYSPYGLLPPIHNGLAVVAIGPVRGEVATCTPFTYRRRFDPSYVIARCDHTPTGNALGEKIVGTDPPIVTPAAGRSAPASLLACNSTRRSPSARRPANSTATRLGYTHASNVTADVTSNDAESSTRTRALVPLKDNADPNFPEVVHDAPLQCATVSVPGHVGDRPARPSSNAYAATRLDDGGGDPDPVVADATLEYGPTWLPVSRARTRYE